MAEEMVAWIWQATETDRRQGLVIMTREEFETLGERAQDVVAVGGVGGGNLKPLSSTLAAPALPPKQAPAPAAPTATPRRRGGTPPAGGA